MSAYRRVYDSHHLQADCQEPEISSGNLRSVVEYGLLLLRVADFCSSLVQCIAIVVFLCLCLPYVSQKPRVKTS